MTTQRAVLLPIDSKLLEAFKRWLAISNTDGSPVNDDVVAWGAAAAYVVATFKAQLGPEREKAFLAYSIEADDAVVAPAEEPTVSESSWLTRLWRTITFQP